MSAEHSWIYFEREIACRTRRTPEPSKAAAESLFVSAHDGCVFVLRVIAGKHVLIGIAGEARVHRG